MSLNITKHAYLIYLTLLTLLLSGVGGVVYHTLMPDFYFEAYPFIPVYFYLFGILRMYLFKVCKRCVPDRMLLFDLAVKVLKLVVSIPLLVAYCIVVQDRVREFLLSFVVLYLVYLIVDTCFFFNDEWKKKLQNKKELKNETVA